MEREKQRERKNERRERFSEREKGTLKNTQTIKYSHIFGTKLDLNSQLNNINTLIHFLKCKTETHARVSENHHAQRSGPSVYSSVAVAKVR